MVESLSPQGLGEDLGHVATAIGEDPVHLSRSSTDATTGRDAAESSHASRAASDSHTTSTEMIRAIEAVEATLDSVESEVLVPPLRGEDMLDSSIENNVANSDKLREGKDLVAQIYAVNVSKEIECAVSADLNEEPSLPVVDPTELPKESEIDLLADPKDLLLPGIDKAEDSAPVEVLKENEDAVLAEQIGAEELSPMAEAGKAEAISEDATETMADAVDTPTTMAEAEPSGYQSEAALQLTDECDGGVAIPKEEDRSETEEVVDTPSAMVEEYHSEAAPLPTDMSEGCAAILTPANSDSASGLVSQEVLEYSTAAADAIAQAIEAGMDEADSLPVSKSEEAPAIAEEDELAAASSSAVAASALAAEGQEAAFERCSASPLQYGGTAAEKAAQPVDGGTDDVDKASEVAEDSQPNTEAAEVMVSDMAVPQPMTAPDSPPAKAAARPAAVPAAAGAATVCIRRAGCTCADCSEMMSVVLSLPSAEPAAVDACAPGAPLAEQRADEVDMPSSRLNKEPSAVTGECEQSVVAEACLLPAATAREAPRDAEDALQPSALPAADEGAGCFGGADTGKDSQSDADDGAGEDEAASGIKAEVVAAPTSPPVKAAAARQAAAVAPVSAAAVCIRRAGCTCADCSAMMSAVMSLPPVEPAAVAQAGSRKSRKAKSTAKAEADDAAASVQGDHVPATADARLPESKVEDARGSEAVLSSTEERPPLLSGETTTQPCAEVPAPAAEDLTPAAEACLPVVDVVLPSLPAPETGSASPPVRTAVVASPPARASASSAPAASASAVVAGTPMKCIRRAGCKCPDCSVTFDFLAAPVPAAAPSSTGGSRKSHARRPKCADSAPALVAEGVLATAPPGDGPAPSAGVNELASGAERTPAKVAAVAPTESAIQPAPQVAAVTADQMDSAPPPPADAAPHVGKSAPAVVPAPLPPTGADRATTAVCIRRAGCMCADCSMTMGEIQADPVSVATPVRAAKKPRASKAAGSPAPVAAADSVAVATAESKHGTKTVVSIPGGDAMGTSSPAAATVAVDGDSKPWHRKKPKPAAAKEPASAPVSEATSSAGAAAEASPKAPVPTVERPAPLEFAAAQTSDSLCLSPVPVASADDALLLLGSGARSGGGAAAPGGAQAGGGGSPSLSPGPTVNAQALRELMALDDVTAALSFPAPAPATATAPAAAGARVRWEIGADWEEASPAAAASRPTAPTAVASTVAAEGRKMYSLEDVERIASFQTEALRVRGRRAIARGCCCGMFMGEWRWLGGRFMMVCAFTTTIKGLRTYVRTKGKEN